MLFFPIATHGLKLHNKIRRKEEFVYLRTIQIEIYSKFNQKSKHLFLQHFQDDLLKEYS